MASVYHLLSRQIPAHIQQQYPIFCKFIEYYYRWLQTRGFVSLANVTNIDTTTVAISLKNSTCNIEQYKHQTITNGSALAEVVGVDDYNRIIIRYLTADAQFNIDDDIHIRANSQDKYTEDQQANLDTATISNVETLPSAFIDHFSRLLDADQIFGVQTPNIATILRTIRQLYQSKGNEQALKYLIKALKGVDVEIKYPWEQVLKVSDGRWKRQYCITVRSDERYWHYVPLNMRYLRLMHNETDDAGNQRYTDYPITKIEVFAKQSENYDQNAKGELTPFSYDIPENGFDNGYWVNIVDFSTLTRFCYDNAEQGFDIGYWLDQDPMSDQELLAFLFDNANQGFDLSYWLDEDGVSGEELFNYEVNQYDDFGPYWIRDEHPELGQYEIDPTTGGIIFDGIKSNCTYGRWGYRSVTPFIRFYFEQDVGAELDQEVRVIDVNQNGEEYVSYVGNVVLGVNGVKVTKPGKVWQVGQIFTSSKDNIWYLYSEPIESNTQRSVTLINQDGISIEYSIDKPLIGRVLTVDDNGGIQTVEIVQYGDHIPEHGGKPIVVSPLFYHDSSIDESEYQAVLELQYSTNPRGVGYFEDPSGFLSYNDIRLQDSNYWQQFSYDIVGNVDGSQYQSIAQLLHPAGTKMFTTYNIEADLDAALEFDIQQTYPFVAMSLFDVAYATEYLEKEFIKVIKEQVSIGEYLDKALTKNIKEVVRVTDGHHDNTIQYQLELNYDSGREDYKWVERTVDNVAKKKTSYVDSGFIKLVHINYDYHIEQDFPQNPPPDTSNGGYITVNEVDGISFVQPIEDRFYDQGETVTLIVTVDDTTRYSCTGCQVVDQFGNQVERFFEYNRETDQYTIRFEMPDSDVSVNIIGETLRYRITTRSTQHGTITPSQIIGFQGDLITVATQSESIEWALESLYYYTKRLGTVYITDTKQFTLPDEHVEVGGTFSSNGGFIHIENNGGGTVTWNVDVLKFVVKGTVVTFTPNAGEDMRFVNAEIINNDGTTIAINNNSFVMPANDIIIRINFAKQQRAVMVFDETQKALGGSAQAKAVFTIDPAPGSIDVGTTIEYALIPSTAYDGILYIRKTENNSTIDIPAHGSILVGAHDITITYALKRNGGYLKYGEYVTSQYQKNIVANVEFNKWVQQGTPLQIRCVDLEGYTFNNYRYFITDGVDRTAEYTYEAESGQTDLTVMPGYDVIIANYEYITNEYNIQLNYNDLGIALYSITPSKISYGADSGDDDEDLYPPAPQGKVRYNSLVKLSTSIPDRIRLKSMTYTYSGGTVDIAQTQQFYAPASDVVINVEFERYDFDVVIDNMSGGTLTLSPSKPTYQLGDKVMVIPSADLYFELGQIYITKSDGSVIDITNDSTFTVDDDITVSATWNQTSFELTIDPPTSNSSGAITNNDNYLTVLRNTRLIAVCDDGNTYQGPVYGEQPKTWVVNAGGSYSLSMSTIETYNPQLYHSFTTCVLNGVNVSNSQPIKPDLTGAMNFTMPMQATTLSLVVSKKYNQDGDTSKVPYLDLEVSNNGFVGTDQQRTLQGMIFSHMRQRDDTNIYWKGSWTGGTITAIYVSIRGNFTVNNFRFNGGGWSDGRIVSGKYSTCTGKARISINEPHPLFTT